MNQICGFGSKSGSRGLRAAGAEERVEEWVGNEEAAMAGVGAVLLLAWVAL